MHQENSGWPGQPRNRGLDAARRRVRLLPRLRRCPGPGGDAASLRRRRRAGERHRRPAARVHERFGPRDARSGRLARSTPICAASSRRLSPQKLFRRSFLEEHGLRFPEGEVRLEDGIFVTRAYLLAGRVSLVGGYPYYRKRQRDDRTNISLKRMTAAGYVGSLRQIAENVRELCPRRGGRSRSLPPDLQPQGAHPARQGPALAVAAAPQARGVGVGARLLRRGLRALGARRSPAGRTAQAVGCGARAGRRRGRRPGPSGRLRTGRPGNGNAARPPRAAASSRERCAATGEGSAEG